MYGYATASFNQILDHLKFWSAHTAVKTAAVKLKMILDNLRSAGFCLKQLCIVHIL